MTFMELFALCAILLFIGAIFGPCGFMLVVFAFALAGFVWLVVKFFVIICIVVFCIAVILFIFSFAGRRYCDN